MSMNLGSSYPMGGNISMMGGMNSIGMSGSSSENMFQYFTYKYGCEDCFRKEPYWMEYPKAVRPEPKNSLQPSLFKRFLSNIFGG